MSNLQVESGGIWDNGNNATYYFNTDNNASTNLGDVTCYFTQLILNNPNQYYASGNNSYKISGSTMQVGSQMYKSNGDPEDYVFCWQFRADECPTHVDRTSSGQLNCVAGYAPKRYDDDLATAKCLSVTPECSAITEKESFIKFNTPTPTRFFT